MNEIDRAIWIRAKLEADPINYEISDRLYTNDYDSGILSIFDKRFEIETEIHNLYKSKVREVPLVCPSTVNPNFLSDITIKHECEASYIHNEKAINRQSIGIYRDVNMYFNESLIDALELEFGILGDELFDTPIGNALLQLVYRIEKSADLAYNMYIVTGDISSSKYTLVDLLDFKNLKDLYYNTEDEPDTSEPSLFKQKYISSYAKSMYDTGTRTFTGELGDAEDLYVGKCVSMLYIIEILYQIKQLKDKTQTILLESLFKKCFTASADIITFIFKNIDTLELQDSIEHLFVNDVKTRISLMYEFVLNNKGTIISMERASFSIIQLVKYAQYIAYLRYRENLRKFYRDLEKDFKLSRIIKKIESDLHGLVESGLGVDTDEDEDDEDMDWDDTDESSSYADSESPEFMEYDSSKKSRKPKKTSDEKIREMRTLDILDKDTFHQKLGIYDFEVDTVHTEKRVSDACKEGYNDLKASLGLITPNLIKQIKEIKVYNTGGKDSGKLKGKLDKKNLYKYKTDHRIFYDNTYKIKESDLAFGIILDVSGSMSGRGIQNGKLTMVLLHEVLSSLRINHEIITHTSHRSHNCIINRYKLFNENKLANVNKVYDILNIDAESGNCDSGALYFMQQEMKRVRNKDKIVMMFSDGEPTECTGAELINQVKDMERDGIRVIGIGINYPSIRSYYPHNANGKDIKDMVNIITAILKEYVLEKI